MMVERRFKLASKSWSRRLSRRLQWEYDRWPSAFCPEKRMMLPSIVPRTMQQTMVGKRTLTMAMLVGEYESSRKFEMAGKVKIELMAKIPMARTRVVERALMAMARRGVRGPYV